ncbi:MAG: hypothetical protein IPK81_02415 [Rhodospirillales bacterium]|nr:MAG: hypothetical protein IPK81_02415 [Rhodospirillales bacterium]
MNTRPIVIGNLQRDCGTGAHRIRLERPLKGALPPRAAALRAEFADIAKVDTRARRVVEHMATALQGSLLVRHAPAYVAEALIASRVAGDRGHVFGTLPPAAVTDAIVARASPRVA